MSCAPTLVVDANETRRRRLRAALAGVGCDVRDVQELAQLVRHAARIRPALVLLAINAGEADVALQDVQALRDADPRLVVIVVADCGSEALAVAALRAGVSDYFAEPIVYADVAASARRCLAVATGRRAQAHTSEPPAASIVTADATMRRIASYLGEVARHDSTVLITGETGTGKELAAAMIHGGSRRRQAHFVSVNCAAIPDALLESELFGHESGAFTGAVGRREGLLQMADRGTVFLDEIGDMGPQAQAKILRAIETRQIHRVGGTRPVPLDLRIVAATNQNLEHAVEEGRFRKDLYFRLNVARVHLPPLRERRSDVRALLDHYLQRLNLERGTAVAGFAPETREVLERYDWPGNVRELKNLVEAVFVVPPKGEITLADLPEPFLARLRATTLSNGDERRQLLDALLAANWNKSRAAQALRWSRMTVYRKMAKHAVVRSTDLRVRRES
jgi:DNA-binding NtrC family response regulator